MNLRKFCQKGLVYYKGSSNHVNLFNEVVNNGTLSKKQQLDFNVNVTLLKSARGDRDAEENFKINTIAMAHLI